MYYEVIWIDDEWEEMETFKEECEVIHQIKLYPFRTQKAGMEALDNNLKRWDAILLDARMLDQSEDNEVAKLDGLRKAIEHINQLSLRRRIPYFIFTGQPDLMDNETFEQSFGKYYNKRRDGQKLIEDMKTAISQTTRFQVKAFYPEAIRYLFQINDDAKEYVIDILETMHFPLTHPDFSPVLYYNQLRQILEWIFRKANRYSIVPNECIVNSNVNLNQSCCYLCGKDAKNIGIRFGEKRSENDYDRIVPKYIEDMMFMILNLGNINSHTTILNEEEKRQFESFLKNNVNNSRYLIFSLALQMCEIAIWFGKYIENCQDEEYYQRMCKKIGIPQTNSESDTDIIDDRELTGIIEEHNGFFHIGNKFYLNPKTVQQRGWCGKKVEIVEYDTNTNKESRDKYKYFACRIRPIE